MKQNSEELNVSPIKNAKIFLKDKKDKKLPIIGKNMKVFRKRQGLSQSDLAILMGVTRAVITNIETGKHNITIKRFIDICNILEITPNQLLSWGEIK